MELYRDFLGTDLIRELPHWEGSTNIFLPAWRMRGKRGFNLIRFQCNGMICWAVSDLNAGELQQFADLFKLQRPASTRM
jgi:hypothetical protein